MRRNPLGPRWALNTIRWLETGPYARVPAVRRLADELREFEGPRTAGEYRTLRAEIERVFKTLESRGKLDEGDDAAAITKALLDGSLGLAESGVQRIMPGERHGQRRPIEERHPQATERQRRMERGFEAPQPVFERGTRIEHLTPGEAGARWARLGAAAEAAAERVAQTARQLRDDPYADVPSVRRGAASTEDDLIKEWNLGYDLDGGGYTFERVRGQPIATPIELLLHEDTRISLAEAQRIVDGMIMWESPDLDYIIGSDVMPRNVGTQRGRAQADLLLIAPGRGGLAWPEKIPETDAEGNLGELMFEKRVEGELYETDHQCMGCEGAGSLMSEETPGTSVACERCEGDGYVISPGGAYAIYERVEIEREDEDEEEDEDEILAVDVDGDEHDMLSRWYSGQGDPLYKLLSSDSIDRGSIGSAISNLEQVQRDIDNRRARLATDEDEDDDWSDDWAAAESLIAKLRAL